MIEFMLPFLQAVSGTGRPIGEFLAGIPVEIQFFCYLIAVVLVASSAYGIIGARRVHAAAMAVKGALQQLGPLDDDTRLLGRSLGSIDG